MSTLKEPSGTSKRSKATKRVIFKGDGSIDALSSRLSERMKLLWTYHMSGYLMEPSRDNEDFKGAVRNIKKGQTKKRWFFKETAVLTHFFHGYGRGSDCYGFFTCQDSLWNQSETMRTLKEPSGTSKRAKTAKRVILKGDVCLDTHFQGYWIGSNCYGLLTCLGTLWNQSETMRTSKEPSGMSKRAKRQKRF